MRKALLLIDIQNIYFTEGTYHLYQPESVAQVASEVLADFRKDRMPVIHVRHVFRTEGYTQDTEYLNAIYKLVAPVDGEKIVNKTCPNSFYQTDLDDYLKKENIDELVVCGMMSHMCVDTTVRACKDRGIKVTVISNACTTKSLTIDGKCIDAETVHNAFMAGLDKMFASVHRYKKKEMNNDKI